MNRRAQGRQRPEVQARRCEASWSSLVAETTSGVGLVQRMRVQVGGQAPGGTASWRLVVQSFDADSVDERGFVAPGTRPLAAAQREFRPHQLERGLTVDLIQVGMPSKGRGRVFLLAWVEPGPADFDFDGLLARPGPLAWLGVAKARSGEGCQVAATLELSAA